MPRYVLTGPNIVKKIDSVFNYLKIRNVKALLISGNSYTKEIALDVIKNEVEKYNHEVVHYSIENLNDVINNLQDLAHKIKEEKINILIGVGGGKSIDSAKLLAWYSNKPYISLPTNVSHDGISSPSISYIISQKLKSKYDIDFGLKSPLAIIADTNLIIKGLKYSLAAGVGDLIAKFTAVKDWRLTHLLKGEEYSEYAASMALMSARIVEKNIEVISKYTEKSVSILLKALIGSGIAIAVAGSSRPASGSEHLFSHSLDIIAEKEGFEPAQHGIQCGIGTIIMGILHGIKWKKIRNTLQMVKAPVNSKELGIDAKYLIKALTIANKIRKDRYTILGDTEITPNIAEKLLKMAEII